MKIFKTCLLLLASLSLAKAASAATELIHNPILTAAAGEGVPVSAVLSGADPSTRVRLYYRVKGKEQFSSVEMGGSPAQVSAEIPGKSVDVIGVEYYIEATLNGAVVASSPFANAKASPHFITVRKDETKPELNILSPMGGDKVETAQPVITVAYGDTDSGIDTSSVLVKIDGVAVKDKGQIQSFDTLMSYVPSEDLSEGSHDIVVAVKDKAGNVGSASWSFTISSKLVGKQAKAAEKKVRWDGNFNYQSDYGHVMQAPASSLLTLPYRIYGVNRGRLEVNGRGEANTFQLKVYKTDEERDDQQPSDRYTALLKTDEGIIALGDYSPAFSELSLYKPYFMRGVTLDLRSGDLREGHTRLMAVFGQTQRAIEGGLTGFTGVPGSAAFGQYVYGSRWEFGGKYFVMGMNAVTINDKDLPTNRGSLEPKSTGMMSSDAQIKIPQIYLTLSGETGADYYFNGRSITDANAGSAYRAGADVNVLPSGTHVSFDWKDLGGSFGFLPGGYNDMANPGLLPDYRGYESSISQSLMDGQLALSLNLNNWRDNLQAVTGRATTTNNFISANLLLALYNLPYLNVGYSGTQQKNDADGVAYYITDTQAGNFNLGLGYTRPINEKTSLSGNFSLINTAIRDQAAKRVSQDLNSGTYVLSAFLMHDLSTFSAAGSMGTNSQPGYLAASSYLGLAAPDRSGSNNTVSVSWGQRWIPRVFDTRLAYDLASNHLETAALPTAAVNDILRSTYSLGANATLAEAHRVGLTLSYAQVSNNASFAGLATSDSLTEMLTSFNYNVSF